MTNRGGNSPGPKVAGVIDPKQRIKEYNEQLSIRREKMHARNMAKKAEQEQYQQAGSTILRESKENDNSAVKETKAKKRKRKLEGGLNALESTLK